jgi:hypothetical protein
MEFSESENSILLGDWVNRGNDGAQTPLVPWYRRIEEIIATSTQEVLLCRLRISMV